MNSTERLPVILTMSGTRVDASLINKQLINTTMAQRSWLGNHSNDVHTPHRFVGAEMFSWFCVLFSSVCSLLIFIKSCTVCVIILPVKTFNMARPLSHVSERRDFISILYSLSYIYTWHFSHYRISSLSLSHTGRFRTWRDRSTWITVLCGTQRCMTTSEPKAQTHWSRTVLTLSSGGPSVKITGRNTQCPVRQRASAR